MNPKKGSRKQPTKAQLFPLDPRCSSALQVQCLLHHLLPDLMLPAQLSCTLKPHLELHPGCHPEGVLCNCRFHFLPPSAFYVSIRRLSVRKKGGGRDFCFHCSNSLSSSGAQSVPHISRKLQHPVPTLSQIVPSKFSMGISSQARSFSLSSLLSRFHTRATGFIRLAPEAGVLCHGSTYHSRAQSLRSTARGLHGGRGLVSHSLGPRSLANWSLCSGLVQTGGNWAADSPAHELWVSLHDINPIASLGLENSKTSS